MARDSSYQNIDEYIAQFEPEVRERMQKLRRVIREAAPEATEKISWDMPTFYLHGNLVHFAGHKTHIGFYPGASGVENFLPRLTAYHTSKGAIQFPLKDEMPYELISDIVRFRVEENLAEAAEKEQKRSVGHGKKEL